MSVETFDSSKDKKASDDFIQWRAAHRRDGFFLNRSSRQGWMLHRADCMHAEMPAGADMASNVKVCATTTVALRAWSREHGEGEPRRCQTCRPPVPPPALNRDD